MGNQQTALSGIHPFKDASDFEPEDLISTGPPLSHPPITQHRIQPPQTIITLDSGGSVAGDRTNTNVSVTGDYSDLIMRPPTPPPRRSSTTPRTRGQKFARLLKVDLFSKHLSLKSLPRNIPKMISRPDLSKLGTVLRFKKKRPVAGEYYPVPPDAERPSPPSKPDVLHEQDEYFLLRWECPAYDGGLPIIGYVIQHVELGLPQIDNNTQVDDTQSWYSSEPGQVTSTEVLLNNLIPGTTYQFRIIAENLLGFSQPGDISDPIVFNPNGELDDWFCPPVLITPLDESYVVIEHERLCLSIEVTGQPYPIVKWFDKHEQEMNKSTNPEKYSTVSSGQKRLLTINSVEIQDAGGVRCVAENEKGVIEHSTRLVVEAPPHIRRVQQVELLRLQNPYELSEHELRVIEEKTKQEGESEEDLIFQAGEQARLKFMYSGAPKPNVCVYHEGDLVDGEETGGHAIPLSRRRVITEVTENLITVKIPNVRRSDRGEWIVRLDNVLGEDAAIVLITVSDRPSEPGKPDVLQLSDNTCILKWDKPYDDGGCPVQSYIVEYYRSEWGVWLKAVTTKNPYTKIRDLIPGSKYKFRVKAENLYGMSNSSGESVEILITDLASTLRSFAGDNEATLLMKPVMEEEEDEAVALEEKAPDLPFVRPTPRARKPLEVGSTGSLRVSTSTMTDLTAIKTPTRFTDSLHPEPRASPGSSPARSPSPRLLQVSLQPQVVVLPEDENLEPPEIQPRRSLSPTPHPLIRTTVQQLNEMEQDSRFLSSRSQHSPRPPSVSPKRSPVRFEEPVEQPPIRPQRHGQGITHFQSFKVEEEEPQKKLYSRAEIIRSAAANQFDYYHSPEEEEQDEEEEYVAREEHEDPELAKVREILSKHDEQDMEDEEFSAEYDVDFDKLQLEYEEDKKRGMVSRQDSGVSNKSFTRDDSLEMSRQESLQESEELEEDDAPRARSVQAELVEAHGFERVRTLPFERAQSEVVVRRTQQQEPKKPESGFSSQGAQEEQPEEQGSSPAYRPRVRSPPRNESTRPFLHDRYTDYIAMKASSRNPKVGSSLRSLSSSRYSSTESIPRPGPRENQDSRKEEEHGEKRPQARYISPRFQFRDFDPEYEKESLTKLEKSAPNKHFKSKSLTLPYDLVHPVQTMKDTPQETRTNCDKYDRKQPPSSLKYDCKAPPTTQHPNISPTYPCFSTPEIYAASKPSTAFLEHSRSETNVDERIPDSTLKYLAGDYLEDEYTEEEYSEGAVLECVLTIDKTSLRETYNVSEIRETSPVGFVDRDVPRERQHRSREISLSSVDEIRDEELEHDSAHVVREIMQRIGGDIEQTGEEAEEGEDLDAEEGGNFDSEDRDNFDSENREDFDAGEERDFEEREVEDQLADRIRDTIAEISEELEAEHLHDYEEKVEAAVFGRIDRESLRRIEELMREEIATEEDVDVHDVEQEQVEEVQAAKESVEKEVENIDVVSEQPELETEDQEIPEHEIEEPEVLIQEGLEGVEVVWEEEQEFEEDTGEDLEGLESEEIAYEGEEEWEERGEEEYEREEEGEYEGEEEGEYEEEDEEEMEEREWEEGDDEVFEMEGEYEELQEPEEESREYGALNVSEFKFKALEEMKEPEYAEKNSQIDDLLSKLDKFLLENPEETELDLQETQGGESYQDPEAKDEAKDNVDERESEPEVTEVQEPPEEITQPEGVKTDEELEAEVEKKEPTPQWESEPVPEVDKVPVAHVAALVAKPDEAVECFKSESEPVEEKATELEAPTAQGESKPVPEEDKTQDTESATLPEVESPTPEQQTQPEGVKPEEPEVEEKAHELKAPTLQGECEPTDLEVEKATDVATLSMPEETLEETQDREGLDYENTHQSVQEPTDRVIQDRSIAQVESQQPTAHVETVDKPKRKTEENTTLKRTQQTEEPRERVEGQLAPKILQETHVSETIEETTLVTDIVDEVLTLEIEHSSRIRKHSTAEITREKAEEPKNLIVQAVAKPTRAEIQQIPKAENPNTTVEKPVQDVPRKITLEKPVQDIPRKRTDEIQRAEESRIQPKAPGYPECKRKLGVHEEAPAKPETEPATLEPPTQDPEQEPRPPMQRSLTAPLNYDKRYQERSKHVRQPPRNATPQEPPPPSGYRPTMGAYYDRNARTTPRGSSESVRSSDDRKSFAPLREILEQEALARTLEPLQWTPKIPDRKMDSIPEQNTTIDPKLKQKPDTLSYRPNMSVYFDRKPSLSVHESRESLASRLQSNEDLSTRSSTPSSFSPLRTLTRPKTTNLADLLVELNKPEPDSPEPSISLELSTKKPKRQELTPETISLIHSLELAPPPPRPDTSRYPEQEDYEVEQVSPFMSYVYSISFYLLLSPMFLFVDSLYVALLCMLLIASVRFFILR